MSDKHYKTIIKIVNLLLVIMFLLCGCTEKPPVDNQPPVISNTDTDLIPEDGIPENNGNSKPLDYSPCEGIHVKAEENVFWQDTTVDVTPEDQIPSKYEKTVNELAEQGMIPIKCFEVNAGLENNEVSPGIFEIEFDLRDLGIDEEFYSGIGVVRVADDGNYYKFSSVLDGDKLLIRSRQNSRFLVTLEDYGRIIDYFSKVSYFWSKGDYTGINVQAVKCSNPYGSYEIQWIMSDIDPERDKKLEKIESLRSKYYEQALEDEKMLSYLEPDKNFDLVHQYNYLLNLDNEYQRLCEETKKVPEVIEYTRKCTDQAYEYLGKIAGIKMPITEPILICRTDSKGDYANMLGSAEKLNTTTIMNLWPLKGMTDETAKDDYLLTITHELFHICQENYRQSEPLIGKLTDDVRYDEMITMVLERDAKEYYKQNGIIKTDPKLTDKEKYDVLRLPIDDNPTGLSSDDANTLKMYEGYMLGSFVMYLQTQYKEKNVKPADLMNARSYYTKTGVSAPLSRAFGMSEDEFDLYFRKWLISEFNKMRELCVQSFNSADYKRKDWVNIEPGNSYHTDLDMDNSYFLTLRGFKKKDHKGKLPAIVKFDENFRKEHPGINLMALQDYYLIDDGCFLDNAGILMMAEIYGRLTPVVEPLPSETATVAGITTSEDMHVGYTLWVLDKTPKPELSIDSDSSNLLIKLPALKGAAAAGLIDGYHLVIRTSLGKTIESDIGKEDLGKEVSFPLDRFTDPDDPEKGVNLIVSICEYVTDNDGVNHLCFVSDEANIDVGIMSNEQCDIVIVKNGVTYNLNVKGAIVYGENPKGMILCQAKPGSPIVITVTSSDGAGIDLGNERVSSKSTFHWTMGDGGENPDYGYWLMMNGKNAKNGYYNVILGHIVIYPVNEYTEKSLWILEPSWSDAKKN